MIRKTLVLASVAGAALAAAPASTPASSTCLQQHVDAHRYCKAVAHRKAIRVYRHKNRIESRRAHVAFHRRPLRTWNVSRLWRANHWERHMYRVLRRLPTWVVIRDLSSWICIHEHEGAWDSLDNNGGTLYHGGLQMDQSFMETYGSDMLAKYDGRGAEAWSVHDQLVVGQRGRDARGWQPWSTRGACGL